MSELDGRGDATEEQEVFRALANPWRRKLLDLLRPGPRTTGDLAAALPELSRYAVMQHLGVLTDAGLVLVRREGRRRLNHLHTLPLQRTYERWVNRLAGNTGRQTLALERHIEGKEQMVEAFSAQDLEPARVLRIENELRFRTTSERLFRAVTTETAEWFPYTYGEDRVRSLVLEERIGGRVYEDWGDGAGHLYGTVLNWDPPHLYAMRGRLHAGTVMDTEFAIAADGDHCALRLSRVIVGPLNDEQIAGIRFHGDLERFEDAIRGVVEASSAQ